MTDAPSTLVNLRDVGEAHPMLVRDALLRSDAPLADDDHTRHAVSWPPRTVIDLRDPGEGSGEHPLAGEAQIVRLPLLGGTAYRAGKLPSSLGELYRAMLEPPASGLLVQAVDTIARADGPLLVHCSAGKDRTGVTIALVLRLLGVPDDEIIADYARTDPAMHGVLSRMSATMSWKFDPDELAGLPEGMHRALAETMRGFLKAIDEIEGGAGGWYRRAGGDEATLASLRTRLLR